MLTLFLPLWFPSANVSRESSKLLVPNFHTHVYEDNLISFLRSIMLRVTCSETLLREEVSRYATLPVTFLALLQEDSISHFFSEGACQMLWNQSAFLPCLYLQMENAKKNSICSLHSGNDSLKISISIIYN